VTTASGSAINSNDILSALQHPDPTTGNPSALEQESYSYNALGQMQTYSDRNGTAHAYLYDVLGRRTSDQITTTPALLLLAVARRSCGEVETALEGLRQLCARQPRLAAAHYELGITLAAAGQGEAALAALRRAVELKPDLADAWLALADHLIAIGDTAGADTAYARHIKAATRDPRLLTAAAALVQNRIPEAEALLRTHLKRHPTDVAALRMLAEVAARLRRYSDAQLLLERCLELAPGFDAARHNYATVLNRQGKAAAALPHVEQLLASEPRNECVKFLGRPLQKRL